MSFTDQLTERGFKYVFRVTTNARDLGAAMIKSGLGCRRNTGNDLKRWRSCRGPAYGSSKPTAGSRGQEDGLEVALKKDTLQESPMSLHYQKLRMANADAVFPISYFTDAVLIIRSMRKRPKDPDIRWSCGYVIEDFKDPSAT